MDLLKSKKMEKGDLTSPKLQVVMYKVNDLHGSVILDVSFLAVRG